MKNEPTISDKAILGALLSSDQLEGKERESFADMLATLERGKHSSLSHRQRYWANEVYERIGSPEPPTAFKSPEAAPTTPFVLNCGPKALKPPIKRRSLYL